MPLRAGIGMPAYGSVDPIFGSRGIPMPLRAGIGMPAYGKFGCTETPPNRKNMLQWDISLIFFK